MNKSIAKIFLSVKSAIIALKPRQNAILGDKFIAAARLVFCPDLSRLSAQEKIIFIKRLAILIESGIPIIVCLKMLSCQANSSTSRRLIDELRVAVESGKSLAQAMDRFRGVFGGFAVSIVKVGEAGGALAKNLDYLAEELRKRRELKRNIYGALVYPSFVLIATVGITIMLTGYVFPKILPIFMSFKTELPATTRALIAANQMAQNYWPWILGIVCFSTALMPFLFKNRSVRYFFDRGLLRLPLLGAMFKSYHIANFARTLGLLLAGQIGIIRALEITANTAGNSAYRLSFEKITAAVKRGDSMAGAIENEKGIFPPLVSQMIGAGESSGNLSSSLIYLSRIYEDEMNGLTKNLSVSIEPALMVFMGILVGFVAVSIITPIYGITQLLQR